VPLKITTLHPRGVLKASAEGLLDVEEILRMLRSLVDAAETRPGHDILFDTRRTRSLLTAEDLQRFAADLGRHAAARGRKFVIVCARDRLDLVRQMESASREGGPTVRVFDSFEAAWDWLGESAALD
jgi:hypothetical protein